LFSKWTHQDQKKDFLRPEALLEREQALVDGNALFSDTVLDTVL